ncbi:MAG: CHAP domain-containing protein [Sporichthyaceae bacterium]
MLLTAPLASAGAGSQTLCRGYEQCRTAGYSDAGYEANSATSYWRMFVGANCTNYVAYRLVRDGLANDRPAADPGQSNVSLNAYAWGVAYASLTNSVPKVGSVAWWGLGAGKGSSGHVAYVEKVHRDGSITISEDSSSGNGFSWKKLTPGQGWPQGFIHFGAANPRALPLPVAQAPAGPTGQAETAGALEGSVFGGDRPESGVSWIEGTDPWAIRPAVEPRTTPRAKSPAQEPRRSTKKKAAKRGARHADDRMGGEVSGALGGYDRWDGSWGPAAH